ncbi:MAG: rane protein [Variibacter sp.]|jgi:membrane protein|nr:rane protein [Variibacter sp.]
MPKTQQRAPSPPWGLLFASLATGIVMSIVRPPRRRQGVHGQAGEADFGGDKGQSEPRSVQHGRAREQGRGRHAVSPWQIPWRGWKDIFWRVYEEIQKDRVTAVAAGVVFFSLLAVFPALTALVSSYGLFADANTIGQHLAVLGGFMPQTSFELVSDQITRIASNGGGKLTLGFVFGLLFALWSANAGMKAIFDALNVTYGEEEKRGFFKLNMITLTFTLGGILALLVALAGVVVLPLVLTYVGLNNIINPQLISILRWPVLLLLIIFGLALLYRFGPSRREAQWRWITPGSAFAAVTWILASLGFSHYLSNFADYNATYGSLGAVIGLMMWMWISTMVILAGAEINAEIEHQTARDTTEPGPKPLGARGAVMADTVGEAKAA